ncbi:hypothetical protein ACFL2V_09570 [Pseudomonadota bacterium]
MERGNSTKIRVKVKTIDGQFVILEDLDHDMEFDWPIDSIPSPLEIGSELYLELKKGELIPPETHCEKHQEDPSETQKRKYLEELVN